jgi:PAT family beta-lactamase induction signal transducer AmpG
LLKAFSLRSTRLAALLAILSLITINGHLVFWPTYVQRQLGWTGSEWLMIEGGYAVWLGVGGSIVGGLVASAIGAKRTVILSTLAAAACWFAYALGADYWTNRNFITALLLAETAAAGFLQVSMFALFMGLCWPPIAATQFTAYMALLNLSNALGAMLAHQVDASFTMPVAHAVLGVLQVALILIVLAIDPNETRRKLGDSSPAKD